MAEPRLKAELSRLDFEIGDPEGPFVVGGSHTEEEICNITADLLNGLFDEPRLFDLDSWAMYDEWLNQDRHDSFAGDREVMYLRDHIDSLSPSELRRLNYLLLIDTFYSVADADPVGSCIPFDTDETYSLQTYISSWMLHLTNTELAAVFAGTVVTSEGMFAGRPWRHRWHDKRRSSKGCRTGLMLPPFGDTESFGRVVDDVRSCVIHPCFGGASSAYIRQSPRRLSAGFHQLFPVIVQLGVMRANELLGIENPEVHLHPALQLRFMEALIAHVRSGRRLIIETHSDLVIRRVIRAILEEDIAQSNVQIYFTELRESAMGRNDEPNVAFHESTVTPIEVDERGRIANWPKGFLDEDVLESQRLLDIMYGAVGREDDDE